MNFYHIAFRYNEGATLFYTFKSAEDRESFKKSDNKIEIIHQWED